MKTYLVTGGIGSGKSYVIGVLKAMGIASYDSDRRAKELYDEDSALLGRICKIAGNDVVKDNRLQKHILAERIFNNEALKREVEAAVFPAVIADFEKWKKNQSGELVIMESAIALEKDIFKGFFDKVIVVTAPVETRIKRAMSRDNVSRELIMQRMANQWSDDQRLAVADYVINNDSVAPLLPQLEMIY